MASKNSGLIIKIFLLIVTVALVSIAHYTFLFFAISLLPTLVAYLLDKKSSKTATSIIGAFNFTGILPHIFSLWNGNNYNTRFKEIISDPYVWFIIYGSTAIGLFIIWLVPEIFGSIYLAKADRRMKEIEKMQKEIVEEWGEEVKIKNITSD